MLSLHYQESMGKMEEHEGKKYLMVDGYMLNKTLDKIEKIIDIEKFDDFEILIDTDDKLPDDVILKNAVILMTYVIKDDDKFYPQIFSEERLFVK